MSAAKPNVRRHESFETLPPDMSELRLVLLGNSWSQRCAVGNFMLGEPHIFDPKVISDRVVRGISSLQHKKMILVNTPDLLRPNLPANRLTDLIRDTAAACVPGPHVFLLVLQPEDFTELHNTRLQSVLESFSEQAFNHSLVLISPVRSNTPSTMAVYMNTPQLKHIIRKCRYRNLRMENLDHEELFTRLGQVTKENSGKHVSLTHHLQQEEVLLVRAKKSNWRKVTGVQQQTGATLSPSVSHTSAIRIVLFGKNDDKKTRIVNFLSGHKDLHSASQHCVATCCNVNGTLLTVVKTPDLFSLSELQVKEEIRSCVSLCSPGPNVLLLLVKPSDFTENNRQTLNSILSLFGPDAFKHSIIVIIQGDQKTDPVDRLLSDCEGQFCLFENWNHLMEIIEQINSKNSHSFLTLGELRTSLNLVLCGSRGAEKSSVVQSMLGQAAAPSPGQCVKHQGEVCGRWVSLVELPALSGKPLEAVMQQCLSCISLCGPEGVHAFILVLPVGPLTDEDKAELQTIQDTFSSAVNPFTMILFTVDPDPSTAVVHSDKGDRDVQELSQSCGGGYLIFNTRGQQQVSELLESVETLGAKNKPHSYTTETLQQAHAEKIIALYKELLDSKNKHMDACDNPSSNCLRMVLIGKTGSGKSSSGNTILGETDFKAEPSLNSVTKACQKVKSTVDGRLVSVVDTPGLFDTNLSQDEVIDEMSKCISLLAPGPHVFLLVLRISRFTKEGKETLKYIKQSFGKSAKRYTIILFTHGDELHDCKKPIEEYINNADSSFQKLLSDCGNRYHVFNNKEKTDRTQVKELLEKIDHMVRENGGGCYTNDMLQEAEAAIKKEMERLLQDKEEAMKREREEIERNHQQKMEEIKRKMDKQRKEFERERNQRDQDLREKEEKIKEEQELRKKDKEERDKENRKREEEEEHHRREWEQRRKALEEKIKLDQESKGTFEKELQESRRWMEQERERSEKERKEWWGKRKEEDEARHQLEQKRREEKKQIEREKETIEKELKEKERMIKEEQEWRKREREQREEEDRRQRKQEEMRRLEWERKYKDLEGKIRSEEESKEAIERKLQEGRKRMEQEKQQWDEEKKEWWEKRRLDECTRHELEETRQREMRKFEKEKEEKENVLKEREKKIKEEQEQRKREWEKREDEDKRRQKQEDKRRQEWEQKCKELEERTKAESESRKIMELKLWTSVRQMEREREEWEKERKERREKQKRDDDKRQRDEQQKLQTLQDEYEEERKRDHIRRQEEDRIRRGLEEKGRQEFEEIFQRRMEEMEKEMDGYKEKARRKAEEVNDFQKKEREKMEAYQKEISDLVQCIYKKSSSVVVIRETLQKHEREMSSVTGEKEKEKLIETQHKELSSLIQKLLKEDRKLCMIL